jgi:hypothetical protein
VALTVDDDARIFDGNKPLKFLRDAEYDWTAPLVAFDPSDEQVLLRATPDGRLKVDASVTVDSVDIGDINVLLKVGGFDTAWDGVLNPDLTTHAGYVQDQRMNFTGPSLDVSVTGSVSLEHGKYYSTDPTPITVSGPSSDFQVDLGAKMRDISVVNDKDIVVKFSNTALTPDSFQVDLPKGEHVINNQNSRYLFITTTVDTDIHIFANGGTA